MTVTTQREECTATVGGRLLMAMELSRRQWKLGFTTGVGQRRAMFTDILGLRRRVLAIRRRQKRPMITESDANAALQALRMGPTRVRWSGARLEGTPVREDRRRNGRHESGVMRPR